MTFSTFKRSFFLCIDCSIMQLPHMSNDAGHWSTLVYTHACCKEIYIFLTASEIDSSIYWNDRGHTQFFVFLFLQCTLISILIFLSLSLFTLALKIYSIYYNNPWSTPSSSIFVSFIQYIYLGFNVSVCSVHLNRFS